LAWGQDEADGIAEGIDTAVQTPDRLIFAPPFLPRPYIDAPAKPVHFAGM
jgi:hypothetical protein